MRTFFLKNVIHRGLTTLFLTGAAAAASLVLAVPQLSYAVGSAADAMCICQMNPQVQSPPFCPMVHCQDVTNGFTSAGICAAPGKCLDQTTGGKAPDAGLSQLTQQLGQLLQQLMKGSGGGGGSGSGSGSPTGSTGCTSYTPTSDATQVSANPCVYYMPSAASQLTTGSTTNSSAQSLLNALGGSGSNNADLSASVTEGAAPLAVTFTTIPISNTNNYTVDPGDGSGPQALSSSNCSTSSGATCTYKIAYTYQTAGTYNATLSDQNGNQLGTVSISVVNPGGSTSNTGSNLGSSLSQVLGSISGLSSSQQSQGQTTTQTGQGSPNFPGVLGNILLNQNGATIFASTVNSANNSETTGFYGGTTIGGQPQGIAGTLCQNRPWASNFLADVIPTTFFDNLCKWGGYQVGQSQQQTQTQTQPQVSLSQQTQSGTSTSKPAATSTATTSTTPYVPPQVLIWAEPSSVPLGARTSIFWNTQGVTSCTESSPDGSFSSNTLSGAAATVPITGATTFTISCIDPSGNPVTDYVTVNLSN